MNTFGSIPSLAEREHWRSMRAVEKLLKENLNLEMRPEEIETVPDPYDRPRVSVAPPFRATTMRERLQPAIFIAHTQATAAALAAGDPQLRECESLIRHPEALEATTSAETASGMMQVALRHGALEQRPQLRGKHLDVHTVRDSNFVFSAIIFRHYENGAVRMRPSRQEILDYLLQKMCELTQDWDYPDPVRAESKLFTELGFESLDAVVLCTAIQEHYQTPMPFAELLAEIGQQQRDLSIDELTDFVDTHLGGPAGTAGATRRVQ
jgi:acyl carrier protein